MKRTLKPEIVKFLSSEKGEKFLHSVKELKEYLDEVEWLKRIKREQPIINTVEDFMDTI